MWLDAANCADYLFIYSYRKVAKYWKVYITLQYFLKKSDLRKLYFSSQLIIIKLWPSVIKKLDIFDILKDEIEKTNTYMKFKQDTNKKLEHKTVCERHKTKSYTKE